VEEVPNSTTNQGCSTIHNQVFNCERKMERGNGDRHIPLNIDTGDSGGEGREGG